MLCILAITCSVCPIGFRATFPMVSSAGAQAAERCSLAALKACATTNDLVSVKSFQSELRSFIGHRQGYYVVPHESVVEQAFDALGGPPDNRDLIGGQYLFGACMFHECASKAAVVLDRSGHIEAVALLSPCGLPHTREMCTYDYTLTVFERRRASADGLIAGLQNWARKRIINVDPSFLPASHLTRTQVIDVAQKSVTK